MGSNLRRTNDEWLELYRQQRESGLKLREWCEKNLINLHTNRVGRLYYCSGLDGASWSDLMALYKCRANSRCNVCHGQGICKTLGVYLKLLCSRCFLI